MTTIHGFTLVVEREITEIGCTAKFFRHERTGAELMSLTCEDENKVFGVSFRTPPSDSTGVPHILEHSVLCGSKKFPVKEPFVELLKGSLQTFLNAFTYPDKTCYPVASANLADFRNLVEVYLDAVFHPLITEQIFQQEGWHYELPGPDGELTRKGVVYNEMKGAYSSPDSLLYEHSQRGLFPDTTYGLDSGGDPKHIPDLTYEQFKAFHEAYYHPTNARFWFYGDDPEDERLRTIDACLQDFDRRETDSSVGLQAAFDAPRTLEIPYAAGAGSKAMFTRNWLLPQTTDVETVLALEVLEHILIGLPSSPLRRALMESGLGEDLAGVGLEDELRQMFFSVGLKGMDAADVDKAETVIRDVIGKMAANGPDAEMVEAAMNSLEFDLRERNTGSFPRGLALMLESLTSWLYDGDPLAPLAFEGPLNALKERIGNGEPVFQELLREHFVNNPHSTRVLLTPDENLAERTEAQERAGLAAILADMGPEQAADVTRNAKALHEAQEAADAPEALASIPGLRLQDIPKDEKVIPTEIVTSVGCEVHLHDLPTAGIVYVEAGLNISCVPGELLALVPVFGRALFEMGTSEEDFASLTMRIARKTGGMGAHTFTSAVLDSPQPAAWLFLRGKATAENTPEMLRILEDVLLDTKLDDKDRFRQIVLEEKARLEQQLIPAGHSVVATRLRARHDTAGWLAERMGGVSALFAMRELLELIDADWQAVLARLQTLSALLVARDNLVVNITAGGADIAAVQPALDAFLESLPVAGAPAAQWLPETLPKAEGLTLPAQVNYVGKFLDLASGGYTFHGSHLAAARFARMGYLWDRVRVQGGAYGAFCALNRFAGSVSFVSYRDPNVDRTLAAYDGAAEFFKTLDLNEEELTKSIIGGVGEVDTYLLPDAQGFAALTRHLTGDTAQKRATMRAELLGTTLEDFRAFGAALEAAGSREIVVLGSADAMDSAEPEFAMTTVL